MIDNGEEWEYHPPSEVQLFYDSTSISIGGCSVVELKVHKDGRGRLFELVRGEDIAMAYCSDTYAGAARDMDVWHMHRIQTDRFVIVSGAAIFALSDGKNVEWGYFNSVKPKLLTIPPGIYHCFRSAYNSIAKLVNFPTHVYNPDDEYRVLFETLEAVNPWTGRES